MTMTFNCTLAEKERKRKEGRERKKEGRKKEGNKEKGKRNILKYLSS
jgi:hypothetical protein